MADGYHNRPRIYELPNNLYKIEEPLQYSWTVNGVPNRLTIMASPSEPYIWDGASIPPVATFITWILPWFQTIYPMGLHIYASAFHDELFKYQGRIPEGMHEVYKDGAWVDADKIWTFTECNKLFARHLREDGVGKKERRAMYLSVQSPIGYYNWIRGKVPEDAKPKK